MPSPLVGHTQFMSRSYEFTRTDPQAPGAGVQVVKLYSKSGQSLPPYIGSGLSHVLQRNLLACPFCSHVWLQPLHSPHVPQAASVNIGLEQIHNCLPKIITISSIKCQWRWGWRNVLNIEWTSKIAVGWLKSKHQAWFIIIQTHCLAFYNMYIQVADKGPLKAFCSLTRKSIW